jgi:uncharacterized protein YjbI with pentapeptide repeats
MANQEHLDILKQGVKTWNLWLKEHKDIEPDFSRANLGRANLRAANLSHANLSGANLSGANLFFASLDHADLSDVDLSDADLSRADLIFADLSRATISRANLSRANLSGANLSEANLSGANLSGADFGGNADLGGPNLGEATISGANLSGANLSGANLEIKDHLRETTLREANLSGHNLNNVDFSGMDLNGVNLNETSLIKTNFSHANLSNCSIYGIAAWDIQLDEHTVQKNLTITPPDQPAITVDNLKIAQFIYLLLNNQEIREVIDTIAKKAVLILGRFTPERKAVLDALREELRKQNYLPVLFDFDKPANRDLTETVSTLAHMARFIIVDLTDPSSAPHEVATVIPQTIVPVQPLLTLQPLIVEGKAVERHEYAMFEDLRRRYHWVLPTFRYQDTADLLASLQEHIIDPAERKAQELAKR